MMNKDLEDKWWCKIHKKEKNISYPSEQGYILELLSLAKQAQPISFQAMYMMFFRSLTNKTGLSIFFQYFLKSILAHSIAFYKWKWHKQEEFIDNLICLVDPLPTDITYLTKKCLLDFLIRQEESLRRLFIVKMQSQHYILLKELMDYELYLIQDFDCKQMVRLQESALPINFSNALEESGEVYIKDHILTSIRKLQHLIRTFPARKYKNYLNFINSHTKYFQIQPYFQLKQTRDHVHVHIDRFSFMRSTNLLSFDKAKLQNETSKERLLKFNKLIEAAQQYYVSTKRYYPKIDENSVYWDQKEDKWKFEIEKPFLDSMGLLVEPIPMTDEIQLICYTPDGNQPIITYWEQRYYWFFIKECLVDNDQQEDQRLTVLQANHVFRLLLLGYHIIMKEKFPIHLPHLKQSQNMIFIAEGIQSDPHWLCAFLPGFAPPQSFSLKLEQLLELSAQMLQREDSQIQNRGILQLKRVSTVRLMLLKRIIALLAHKKYFGRLLNAKKYLIIFHLTAIELMFLFQIMAIGETRRPYSAPRLREELFRSLEALNKAQAQHNYQSLAYAKIQAYKIRQDEQSIFLEKEKILTQNAATINAETNKMRKIDQKMQQLEKQMSKGYTGYVPSKIKEKYNSYLLDMSASIKINISKCFIDLLNLNNSLTFEQSEKIKSLHKIEEEKRGLGRVVTFKLSLMIQICLRLNIQSLAQMEAQILPMVLPGEAGEIPQQKFDKPNLQMTLHQLKEAQQNLKDNVNFCSSLYETNSGIILIEQFLGGNFEPLYEVNSQFDLQFEKNQQNEAQ